MQSIAYKQHDSVYIELCLWLPPRVAICRLLTFQLVMEKLPQTLLAESATSDEGETHYFIMTVDFDVLVKHGVVSSQAPF